MKSSPCIYEIKPLQLGTIFNQRLRQTEGFGESIISLMDLNLIVPDYSTLSRRAATMHIPNLSSMLTESSEPIDIAIDSTGLKTYGAGEWFINKHGNKHRSWQKLHLTIDLDSQKIIATELTTQDVGDSPCCLKNLVVQGRLTSSPDFFRYRHTNFSDFVQH